MSSDRHVPARIIPAPDHVSPALRSTIAAEGSGFFRVAPRDPAEWRARIAAFSAPIEAALPDLLTALGVKVRPAALGGAAAFDVRPVNRVAAHEDRVLLHFHGGARVLLPGLAGTREAIVMAGFCGIRVLSVDYRMPPDHPFPAALDDAIAAYRALLDQTPAGRIGLLGYSAGGSLCFSMLFQARAAGLPMPGCIIAGAPTVDLTGAGDTLHTNAFVDNVLETADGFIDASIALYADGHDLRDPRLSPIYGELAGLPAAMLTSGTRDLYLSHTVRMHRALRDAGVTADLHVWEGQSHGQYMANIEAPETRAYHDEVSAFLARHLD